MGMTDKLALTIFILLFCLISCQPADPLLATWKIVRVSYEPSGRATPEALARGRQIQAMSAGLQNSTFALYEGQRSAFFSTKTPYRQGTWSVEGDRLRLQMSENGAAYEFEIAERDENTLILILLDTRTSDGELVVSCRKSRQYIHDGVDLLSPEANTWRVKPTRKETPEQVKARAIQHLDYLITYFEGVKENKQGYFEIGIISSPFVFYAHGLGLSRETATAQRWRESFYDEQNAAQGFDYLRAALRSLKKYPKADTFTEEYLLAFRNMRAYFDQ
ncbi:hypothetical protein [Salmonirosea aquatica]|uniref:Uncharacterized protein n=1 Tax=Salmonirosea aquatica TaxID=2654236 RepID=A0A7C9BIS0_9BACT|nr:hypothetical protein [Cytophagaceae bacterium SJW1-29]